MAIGLAQTDRTKSSLGNTLWDVHVWQKVCEDEFMRCAVVEVLKTIEPLFKDVLRGPQNGQYLLSAPPPLPHKPQHKPENPHPKKKKKFFSV